jgi:hypothetical protein
MEADLRLIALEDDIAEIYPTQQVFNDEVEVEPTTEVPTYDVEFVDAVEV